MQPECGRQGMSLPQESTREGESMFCKEQTVLAQRIRAACEQTVDTVYLEATVRSFSSIALGDYIPERMQQEREDCVQILGSLHLDACNPSVDPAPDPLQQTVGHLCYVLAMLERERQGAAAETPETQLDERTEKLYRVLAAPLMRVARQHAQRRGRVSKALQSMGLSERSGERTEDSLQFSHRRYNERVLRLALGGAQLRAFIDVAHILQAQAIARTALDMAASNLSDLLDAFQDGTWSSAVDSKPHALVTEGEIETALTQCESEIGTLDDMLAGCLGDKDRAQDTDAMRAVLRYALVLPFASAYRAGALDASACRASSLSFAGPVLAQRLSDVQSFAANSRG